MRGALRSRDFRLLWTSQSVSVVGDAMVVVAIGIFVTRHFDNPRDVGIVLTGYTLPLPVLLLVGGVVADRLPRQLVMVATDGVRCALHAALAALIATGAVRVWQMTLIGVLFGSAESFFRPAYTGLVPQTVPEGDIQGAQALGGLSRELATFASPALATAIVLGVGAADVFAVDAATFAVSALLLQRVRTRRRGEAAERSSVLQELVAGWRELRARSWVWATIIVFSGSMFLSLAPFFVLGADIGRQVYGSEAVYGLASTAWGAGTVTGAVLGGRWRPRRPLLAALLVATPWPVAMLVYAEGPQVGVTYAVIVVSGVGIGMFLVWWETALATRIPPQLLSRVSAWDWMGSLALLPVGYLLAGPVAASVGAVRLLEWGSVAGTVLMACGLLPRSTRELRRLEPDASTPAGMAAG